MGEFTDKRRRRGFIFSQDQSLNISETWAGLKLNLQNMHKSERPWLLRLLARV